jgi:hypothetical protein
MPTNQRVGFDDDQRIPPIEPSGESGESETDRVGGSPRPNLPLDEKAELFAKKQILGGNRGGGLETETDKHQSVEKNAKEITNGARDRPH